MRCVRFKIFFAVMKLYLSMLSTCLSLISQSTAQFPERGVGSLCPDNKHLDVRPCSLQNGRNGVCARQCVVPRIEYAEICCHLKEPKAFKVYYCCEEAVPGREANQFNSDRNPRIFPYLALMGWYNPRVPNAYVYKCTSVAISARFLLTAAHCAIIDGLEANVVKTGGVRVLEYFIERTIDKIHIHPDYDPKTAYNDIALIQLVGIAYGKQIKVWTGFNYPNTSFTAAGYGDTTTRGLSSHVILKANLDYVENDECQRLNENKQLLPNGIAKTQLCAKDLKNLSETCQGDSGGPLIMSLYENNGTKKTDYLVGITSFGQGCGSTPPGVYTRVSAYIDWINEIMERTTNTTLSD